MSDLYKETFSQVRSSYEFNMEDFDKMKTRRVPIIRTTLLIAAVVAVLAALSLTASATGFFGLQAAQVDEERDWVTISAQGWADSPEGKALREVIVQGADPREAAQRNGLTVPEQSVVMEYDELTELLGGEISSDAHTRWSAVVDDNGSVSMDGDFTADDGAKLAYQLRRTAKGSFGDVTADLDKTALEEWTEEIGGRSVYFAMCGSRSVILSDLGDGFLTVYVLAGSESGDYGSIIRDHLEQLARSLDLDVLSRVVKPDVELIAGDSVKFGPGVELVEGNVLTSQSFRISISGIGQTSFITYLPTEEFDDVRFFLSADGKVSDMELKPVLTGMEFKDVAAVSFEDLNGDGIRDILLLIDYVTGEGDPYRDVRIFAVDGKGGVEFDSERSWMVLDAVDNSRINVPTVRGYLKGNMPEVTEDGVIWTVQYEVGSRRVALDLIGRKSAAADMWGVKELRLSELDSQGNHTGWSQTIDIAKEAGEDFVYGLAAGYTECPELEQAVTVGDMDFDGELDIGVFGWVTNNTIPGYYFLWDGENDRYVYAGVLQGAELDMENRQIVCRIRSTADEYVTERYEPNGAHGFKRINRTVEHLGKKPEVTDISAAYSAILDGAPKDELSGYAVYDIDGDGTPELLVQSGDCEAAALMTVYTLRDGEAVSVGDFDMFHSNLYVEETGTLIRVMGQMGLEEVYKISLTDGKISEEKISERDIGYGWYVTPGRSLMVVDPEDRTSLTHSTYADVIMSYRERIKLSGDSAEWITYDINRDGHDELFVNVTGKYGSGLIYVYTQNLSDGSAVPMQVLQGGKDMMFIAGADGLYTDYRDLENSIERVKLISCDEMGNLVETTVMTAEDPSADTWAGFQFGPAVSPHNVTDGVLPESES